MHILAKQALVAYGLAAAMGISALVMRKRKVGGKVRVWFLFAAWAVVGLLLISGYMPLPVVDAGDARSTYSFVRMVQMVLGGAILVVAILYIRRVGRWPSTLFKLFSGGTLVLTGGLLIAMPEMFWGMLTLEGLPWLVALVSACTFHVCMFMSMVSSVSDE